MEFCSFFKKCLINLKFNILMTFVLLTENIHVKKIVELRNKE
jgi:hypothetical protein